MAAVDIREMQKKRVVVVGIGNVLLKDEGIGVHVSEMLQGLPFPEGVSLDIIDGGTCPDVFLSLGHVDKLIVIDAADGAGKPGTIYRIDPEDIECDLMNTASTHDIALPHSLKMMECLGDRPNEIVIFGIQPGDIDWGLEPTPDLKEIVPNVVKLIQEEMERC